MAGFQVFCFVSSLIGIISNALIVFLSFIKTDNTNKDVHSTFSHICCSAIIIAIGVIFTMPQEVRNESALIKIPHGLLSKFSSITLEAISGLQMGCYVYILLNLCILFLNRLNVMCNKNNMSTLFGERNMKIITGFAVAISLIQMAFVFLSTVQSNMLWERLNKTTSVLDDLYEKQELSVSYIKNQQVQLNNQNQIESGIGNMLHSNSSSSNAKEQTRSQVEATRSRISVYGNDFNVNPIIWGSDGLFLVIFIASYATIIISSISIRNSLKSEQSDMSDNMKQRQKGLYNALIFYSILPCVITIIIYANFFQGIITGSFAVVYQQYVTTIMVSLLPTMLGVFVFIFIKFYRESFVKIILRKKEKVVKDEELPEIDSLDGNKQKLTTSQMKGIINQGFEESTITMPQ
uniref:G_PROTEIN_RECEP_F1_2 domain-containing protein n=1 Tax=Strongyloides papillosus TaxID=174720 RepID=A0A0N5BS37_STREA